MVDVHADHYTNEYFLHVTHSSWLSLSLAVSIELNERDLRLYGAPLL
jgi:hypothetical protein